ncbi:MAG TPA: S4 domain-containing protein, partial [Bdellovibrionota bacterium]|nr:S4 domain-containing protein [Bdellovibrionota bacterium]
MAKPERLQKLLSRSGLLSRRRAELAISQGRVAVNGRVVREMGATADPDKDVLTLDGKTVKFDEPFRTILLH